jgi:hypothetical protein
MRLATGPPPKCHFVLGVPKFPKLGLLQLWKPIFLCADLWLKWSLKQSCSFHRDLFNNMWHTTCTQVNQGNSQLLMVGSQIDNLIPDFSFNHNLYFKYSNGSCEPISDIFVPRYFQWYKEFFNLMDIWPLQWPFEDSRVNWDSNSQNGSSFGSLEVHSLTLSHITRSMKCECRVSFLAYTFTSPCFGREPKVRVATLTTFC